MTQKTKRKTGHFDPFKAIMRQLVLAQVASDSAKGKFAESYEKFQGFATLKNSSKIWNYKIKDEAIIKALSLIDKTPYCGVNYYVVRALDQNGCPSNIIYFTFKIDEKRYQISFHNFRSVVRKNYAEPKKGLPCHWEGGIGGSREAAIKLIEKYFS